MVSDRAFQLTTFITTVANLIATDLSSEELALLSSLFMQLGDTLTTIALVRDQCEQRGEDET